MLLEVQAVGIGRDVGEQAEVEFRHHAAAPAADLPLSHLQPAVREFSEGLDEFPVDIPTDDLPFEDLMGKVEKLLLDQALRRHGGNKAKAAKALGLKRTTLLYKLKAQECLAGAA